MKESFIKRKPPYNREVEQALIGAMLIDNDIIKDVVEVLVPDDFYDVGYRTVYEAICDIASTTSSGIDVVMIQDKMVKRDAPEEYTTVDYLKGLVLATVSSANYKSYVEIIKDNSNKRKLIRIASEMLENCYNTEDTGGILTDAEKKIFSAIQENNTGDSKTIQKIMLDCLDEIETASKTSGSVTGIASGFIDLDYKTAGFQPSDLILIAARPSMGKTAFVLNIAEYIAVRNKTTTAIFSLEMSSAQLGKRLISMRSRVDSQRIRTGNLADDDWGRVISSVNEIGNSQLIIDDTPAISINELASKCRKYKQNNNLGLIIIDYIQLMTAGRRIESRQQEVSEISKSLKALARELKVPVIALSQLSREVEKRNDKRPMLSDLRESGAIEQDADVVMFLYRDDYYNKEDSKTPGIAEVIIAKQRNGPTGIIKLGWQAELTRFVNAAP